MKKAMAAALAVLTGISVMMAGSVMTASAADETELNIYMWGDYISEDLIAQFEQDNGCKVNLSFMSDNADAVNKLTAGAGSEYDLIMTCDAYMQSLIEGDYLEKLDLSKLPTADANLNKSYWTEDIREYCVPYLMNYIYVVYNSETCPLEEITCYNDLLDPALAGQIGSVDGARNLFPIALVALGYDPNSTNEDEIAEAYEWLTKYNENVLAYGSTEQNMVSGAISVMFTYDGNAAWAMEQMGEDNPLVIAPFTEDPVQLGMDLYVIPKGARTTQLSKQPATTTRTARLSTLITRPTSSSRRMSAMRCLSMISTIRCLRWADNV